MWLGSLAEIFVAYAATEAVLAVAIYFLELYQGLGVCRIGGIKPCVVPHFYNVVLLGLQLLKQAEAAGTHLIVSFVPAKSMGTTALMMTTWSDWRERVLEDLLLA